MKRWLIWAPFAVFAGLLWLVASELLSPTERVVRSQLVDKPLPGFTLAPILFGLDKFLAGGMSLGFRQATGIDLPEEKTPFWPEAVSYFDRQYGRGNWTNAVTLNLAIVRGVRARRKSRVEAASVVASWVRAERSVPIRTLNGSSC